EFQLEQVLDRPMRARIARIIHLPRERLEEVIVADLDVGGDEIRDGWNRGAEHHVLPSGLQIVVDDLEGARPVPAVDSLSVELDTMDFRNIRIDDRGRSAVEGDTQ